ncbi:MAG: FAD-binding protein [Pleomorphochaeta sp.]
MTSCIILNGCSPDYKSQALIVNSVINNPDNAIIIYDDKKQREQLISLCPSKKIHLIRINTFENEAVLNLLAEKLNYDLVIFPPNIFGTMASVRLGERLKGSSLTNVETIDNEGYTKKVYSGYMNMKFNLHNKPICISLDKSIKESEIVEEEEKTITEEVINFNNKNSFIKEIRIKDIQTDQLKDKDLVIAIGNGIKSESELNKIASIASKFGFSYGVSRPIAMNGFTKMDKLIGVSGAIIKPKICIAIGVSGAPAFYQGIEKSEKIIAVNTDKDSLIFQQSDIKIIGDYKEFIEELEKIERENND